MSQIILDSIDKVKNKQQELGTIKKELLKIMEAQIILIVKEKAKEFAETTKDIDVLKFKVYFEQSGYDPEPIVNYYIMTKNSNGFVRFEGFFKDRELKVKEIGVSNVKLANELKRAIQPIMQDEELVDVLVENSHCDHIIIDLN